MLGHQRGRRMLAVLGVATVLALPALAKVGDKQGWTLAVDAQKQTTLFYVPAKDGPRLLTLSCVRNDSFEIQFEGAIVDKKQTTNIPLTLSNGEASYVARGEVGHFTGTSAMTYDSLTSGDAKTLIEIQQKLFPVLEGPGPIVVKLGTITRELATAGIADHLKRFRAACFGPSTGPSVGPSEEAPPRPTRRRQREPRQPRF
jgi:hypothetical protein